MRIVPEKRVYEGRGQTISGRGVQSPLFAENDRLHDPRGYLPDTGLIEAVNVALTLGMPLLVTGEPGTGKTQLAASVAYELELPLFTFYTKSGSSYQDLSYRYDSLRHFKDVQLARASEINNYIEFGPLGKAILAAMDLEDPSRPINMKIGRCTRSVVLIDEVDKAPRDFPNDILNEIEMLSFEVNETHQRYSARQSFRPILILTSNLEKDLPDPFKRRCAYYNIPFPEEPSRLEEIIRKRLDLDPEFGGATLMNAIEHFRQIRSLGLEKQPATAELLAWVDLLQRLGLDVKDARDLDPPEKAALLCSYSLLAKGVVDLKRIRDQFKTIG